MTLYKVQFRGKDGEHHGSLFFPNYDGAFAAATKYYGERATAQDVEFVEFNPTKSGVLLLLRRHAQHADNG